MTMPAEKGSTEVARPLRVLVPLIKQEVDRGYQAGIEHYRRAGELLLEAKAQLAHGEWASWLRRHCTLSERSARAYMKLASEMGANRKTSTFRNLSEVAYAYKRPSWQAPVREILRERVDVDKLAQDRQDREKEQRLTQELGRRFIEIAYKVLATQLHPDKGGSREAMVRLNRLRDHFKAALERL